MLELGKIYIYDIEVFKYDWIIVFKEYGKKDYFVFHNDIEGVRSFLAKTFLLVGFNNYNYDDPLLVSLITNNLTPYDLYLQSQKIINGEKLYINTSTISTIDCMQELRQGLSLKVIEAHLGKSIKETTVPFNIDRPLTEDEIIDVSTYCMYDVENTQNLFTLRSDYFQAKIDIINEFRLTKFHIKKTRAYLASEVLEATSKNISSKNDRLLIDYVPTINWENIPNKIKNFYDNIKTDYINGVSYEELEKKSLDIDIAGVPHTYGFGGVHGALDGFIYEGNMLYLDFSSYYPSLMIEYNLLSRACNGISKYKNLYDTRFKLKKNNDSQEYIYKILLNASYGATKDKFNTMFDPVQANNICINGQLIITDLALRIAKFGSLVQTNTDGLIFTYDKSNLDDIKQIMASFEKEYKLKLGVKYLTAIYQRDVNNYIIKQDNGKVSGIGRFKNWNIDKINFESNNLSIIDIALKRYYIDKIPIETTIDTLIKEKKYLPFQIIAKSGSKYEGLAQHNTVADAYEKLPQKVNRVFASKLNNKGGVYKYRENKYSKIPNTPNNTYIFNGDIKDMDFNMIDNKFYIDLVKSYMIENKKIKNKVKIDKQLKLNLWTL